jgi:hypothetical protein
MSGPDGPFSGMSTEDLRAAVRQVLRDVLPAGLAQETARPEPETGLSGDVALRTDTDLDTLIRRIAALCEDPRRRAALLEGRHGFRLRGESSVVAGPAPPAGRRDASAVRVERGAVTERTVMKAAADGARLVMGRRAVLTPLARDKARVLGVEIERER